MNPFQPKDTNTTDIKSWAEVVGLILAVSALAKLIWDPIERWYFGRFERTLLITMRKCAEDIERILKETALKAEMQMLEETSERSLANKDALSAAHAALEAQGIALRHLQTAADKLETIPESMERFEGALGVLGRDLAEILGRLKERDKWDGINRRQNENGGSRRESDGDFNDNDQRSSGRRSGARPEPDSGERR